MKLTRMLAPAAAAAALAAFALPAAADSPFNSAQGAFDAASATGLGADHIAFSARSDALFQHSRGLAGTADGMINFQPDTAKDLGEPTVGRVPISCLNVVGNEAIMTGTATAPISSNAFTGPPFNAPPNEWIVGASLAVIDNGDSAPITVWGYFVNPDPTHVISTPRCFGPGLDPASARRTIDSGHVNVTSSSP